MAKKDKTVSLILIILNLITLGLCYYINYNYTMFSFRTYKFIYIVIGLFSFLFFLWSIFFIFVQDKTILNYALLYIILLMISDTWRSFELIRISAAHKALQLLALFFNYFDIPSELLNLSLNSIFKDNLFLQYLIGTITYSIILIFLLVVCYCLQKKRNISRKNNFILISLLISVYCSIKFSYIYSLLYAAIRNKEFWFICSISISLINFLLWIVCIYKYSKKIYFLTFSALFWFYPFIYNIISWLSKNNQIFTLKQYTNIYIELAHITIFPMFCINYRYEIIPVSFLLGLSLFFILFYIIGKKQ